METQNFFESKFSKVLLTMTTILGSIIIAKSGYQFGQWLYQIFN